METNEFLLIPLIALGFPIAFGTIWTFVLWIISHVAGWQTLARHYHTTRPFSGKTFRFQSARLNRASYSGVLEIGVNEEGIRLVPFFLFRPFHKPLFIPWYDIQTEPATGFLIKMIRLSFTAAPKVKISLYQRTFEKIEPFMKGEATYFPG